MRENHYAISCIKTKSFSGFQFARRITLLFSKMSRTDNAYPTANLTIFSQCLAIRASNIWKLTKKQIIKSSLVYGADSLVF